MVVSSCATSAYDSASIRAFNILVETSDDKSPPDSAMGRRAGVLDAAAAGGDGHIPRNMRLALLLTDIVEPYVTWANPEMRECVCCVNTVCSKS